MLISSILGGVGALGSAIYGAVKSSQANKRARQLIQDQRDENRRWYNTKMNQDYTMRTDVQNAINKQRELLDEQYKRAKATNVVGGGSDESLALQKEAANKSLADTTADIAAAGANYKDQVEQQYRANDAALNQQQAQSYQQQAAQTAQAASQAVNAGINLVGQGLGEMNIPGADAATSAETQYMNNAEAAARANIVNDGMLKAANNPIYTSEDLAKKQQVVGVPKAVK